MMARKGTLPKGIEKPERLAPKTALEVEFMRGKHAGIYEAYLSIRGPYPAAGNMLLKRCSMQRDGTIVVRKVV